MIGGLVQEFSDQWRFEGFPFSLIGLKGCGRDPWLDPFFSFRSVSLREFPFPVSAIRHASFSWPPWFLHFGRTSKRLSCPNLLVDLQRAAQPAAEGSSRRLVLPLEVTTTRT